MKYKFKKKQDNAKTKHRKNVSWVFFINKQLKLTQPKIKQTTNKQTKTRTKKCLKSWKIKTGQIFGYF